MQSLLLSRGRIVVTLFYVESNSLLQFLRIETGEQLKSSVSILPGARASKDKHIQMW